MPPKHVVIVGAGIAGLTIAWRLATQQANVRVTLLEAAGVVGGNMQTHRYEGHGLVETGPRGFRPSGAAGAATLRMAQSLGLSSDILAALPERAGASDRFVLAGGRIRKIPSSIREFARYLGSSDSLAGTILAGILREPFTNPRKSISVDETVHSFATRHFGTAVADQLLDPLCVGIFGGDARHLSLAACFPPLAAMEQRHRSLVLGQLLARDTAAPAAPPADLAALLQRVGRARLYTLKGGLDRLTHGLHTLIAGQDNMQVQLNATCVALEHRVGGGVRVLLSDGTSLEPDHVVAAVPAWRLADWTTSSDPALASLLQRIPFHDMVTVNVVYADAVLPFDGFGYLVPTTEPSDILGVVFDSAVFPEQNTPGGATRLTVMAGGHSAHRVFGHVASVAEHKELAAQVARQALQSQLGILATPCHTYVKLWPRGMPQYCPGHLALCAAAEAQLAAHWAGLLHVAGNSYYGAGVNDTVLHATALADRIAAISLSKT